MTDLVDTEETEIASPLPFLFAEEGNGDRQAREALFCTFNADLGYFERTILGVTQAAGARATIVGDARVSHPDPRAARNAGTRYVHGVAVLHSRAAFHPKVTVIAGPERALVAVGSGNLSPGGWHLNAETWTVATADREHCPVIVTEVAAWLRTLEAACAITPQALEGVIRTAKSLEQLAATADSADTGHRLVHTSSTSIMSQLPGGDVEQLLLYAPFHDDQGAAVRELIRHLRPRRVTLAVQSDKRTVIQPGPLRQAVVDLGVPFEVVEETGDRYRHGKLVEAVAADGSRWALTGSPNLSGRALLRSVGEGGNMEVGVISRPDTSLFPEGTRPIALDAVPAVSITGDSAMRPAGAATLLSVLRTADGLELVFARPTAGTVRIFASVSTDFDRWSEVGEVPHGVSTHVLTGVDFPGGTRVRCAWGEIAESQGSVVFVTDRDLVMVRPGETTGRRKTDAPHPANLTGDPRILQLWLSSLSELASLRPTAALPSTRRPAAPRGEHDGGQVRSGLRIDTDEERWLDYTDDARAIVGSTMFDFMLGGLAGLRTATASADGGLRAPTDKLVEENKAVFDNDDEHIVDDTLENPASVTINPKGGAGALSDVPSSGLTNYQRSAVCRLLAKAADKQAMARLPALARLAVVTAILCAIQSGVWDSAQGERGWLLTIAQALQSLDQEDIPEPLNLPLASWTALAIYLMHAHRPTHARTAEALAYEEAASSVAHLLPAADAALISDLAEPFTNANGYPVDPDAVMHVIDMVVQSDPLEEAIDVLETTHPEWRVDKHNDSLLHVRTTGGRTFLAAVQALDAIPGTHTVAVLSTNATAAWTITIRHEGMLIHIERSVEGEVTWRHYRLGNLISPTGIARDQDLANRVRVNYGKLNIPFNAAVHAAKLTGLDLAADPPSDCPG